VAPFIVHGARVFNQSQQDERPVVALNCDLSCLCRLPCSLAHGPVLPLARPHLPETSLAGSPAAEAPGLMPPPPGAGAGWRTDRPRRVAVPLNAQRRAAGAWSWPCVTSAWRLHSRLGGALRADVRKASRPPVRRGAAACACGSQQQWRARLLGLGGKVRLYGSQSEVMGPLPTPGPRPGLARRGASEVEGCQHKGSYGVKQMEGTQGEPSTEARSPAEAALRHRGAPPTVASGRRSMV
jgi:hypothetical protein